MRQDQFERMQALNEKLTDVFLREADPSSWTGGDTPPSQLTQQERGDRYWCKKNAVATAAIMNRILSIVGRIQMAGGTAPAPLPEGDEEGEGGLDAEVAAAEAEATRLLNQTLNRAKATKPTHGKA